jgi:hypothetical protein
MLERNHTPRYLPVRAIKFLLGKSLLCQGEFIRRIIEMSWVGNHFAIGQRGKVSYANVNTHTQAGLGQRRGFFHLAHQANVPTRSAFGYSQLFNCALNLTREEQAMISTSFWESYKLTAGNQHWAVAH